MSELPVPDLVPSGKPPAPDMPKVDISKLQSKYPELLGDNGNLQHGIGWQRRPDSEGGACFLVTKWSVMGGFKVLERFPLTETGWADAWSRLVELDRGAAKTIIRRLAEREAARNAAVSGAVLPKAPPRFPSSVETRRRILQAIAPECIAFFLENLRGCLDHVSWHKVTDQLAQGVLSFQPWIPICPTNMPYETAELRQGDSSDVLPIRSGHRRVHVAGDPAPFKVLDPPAKRIEGFGRQLLVIHGR